jgi:hypothetical protein
VAICLFWQIEIKKDIELLLFQITSGLLSLSSFWVITYSIKGYFEVIRGETRQNTMIGISSKTARKYTIREYNFFEHIWFGCDDILFYPIPAFVAGCGFLISFILSF